jgi:hypothetical protein
MESIESERYKVEQVIHDTIRWALTKDFERLYSTVAQDEEFFIYHPDSKSTIQGFEAFRQFAEKSWTNEAFKATDYAIKGLRITFAQAGNAAWYACLLDDHAEWNGKPAGWDNCRWTGTLEKRDGRWVVVQMHFSFPKDG